jgi:hypothetical protein
VFIDAETMNEDQTPSTLKRNKSPLEVFLLCVNFLYYYAKTVILCKNFRKLILPMTASYIVWRNCFSLFYLIPDFLLPTDVTKSNGNIPVIIQISWEVELSS